MATQLEIDDGPNKFDLMVALFDHNNDHPRHVRFILLSRNPSTTTTQITSVEREDGSGHNWNIVGYLVADGVAISVRFMAFYDLRTRKGKFTIVK